jgi:hypothetical protein
MVNGLGLPFVRWALIGVGYTLGRSSSMITGQIPRFEDLLSGGETWTDLQGGDPSSCRLI